MVRIFAEKLKTTTLLVISALLLTSCVGGSSSNSSDGTTASDVFNDLFNDSPQVSMVKDSYVQACSTATLGEMADAFMGSPTWRDFTSTSGATVVELSGEISYDGVPSEAVIQFLIDGSSFEATYLGIGGVDQNLLMLSSLLTKMCDAA